MSSESKAQELISIFECSKDTDIENFLKYKAIAFEKLGKSRTFFIYDEDKEGFTILAYFTLALQVLKVPEILSNRNIKNFDGFNAKIHGEKITEFPTILIGQFSGNELMQYCLNTVFDGQMHLGGRIIMLECKNISYLIQFYEQFGFVKLDKDYHDGELLQLIKVLREEELIEKKS